ncbi:MAG: carbon-phosphorus lyase complex subunit PhnI [Spirochaetaceae bacterium]|nr:carbon-phosphorus lyase complex subunit PhnI [Spirochaetaceae bacterium]MDT8296907.1 carbon-phosphorus lyase complex subunit PhnI [Spirochaetaceae bacterium]
MGYIAVKGGSEAIEASLQRLQYQRLEDGALLPVDSVRGSLKVLVDQVMAEASMYDETTAALAIKQGEGSPEEAVFLLRAFRSTLPRLHYSRETTTEAMWIERRISASFKDIPGGQILGSSPDYSHRLLDFSLMDESDEDVAALSEKLAAALADEDASGNNSSYGFTDLSALPKVVDYLRREGLMADPIPSGDEPKDITKDTISFPTKRAERLQILARGQTGAVTAFGYAAQRGYGAVLHPTVGELRVGRIPVEVPNPYAEDGEDDPEDGYYLGEIRVTEVESLIPVPVKKPHGKTEIAFSLGYGICYGRNETKAIAMSLLDFNLSDGDKDQAVGDEELILLHIDSVEATGFTSHLKLPHYVTFQSKLDSVRKTRDAESKAPAFVAPGVGGSREG